MEDNKDKNTHETETEESNAAKRIKALGEIEEEKNDEPITINKWANFWYHHKTKVIMITFFAFVIGVIVVQLVSQSNPDISIIYAGPDYITANMNRDFCDMIESLIDDYNDDGKKYVQLNDMIYKTEGQIAEYEAELEANGEDGKIDMAANAQTAERFTYEIFGGDASICILAEDQYQMVAESGGFMRLDELFEEIPEGAIDDCGVRFNETKLCKFYSAAQIFPEDSVIAIRKISTMSAFTGKKKAERVHEYSKDLFCKILNFEYPEGYVETDAE